MSKNTDFDLVIIGGGINGAGIARDAAGRGLRVLLAEQDDLASATSSRSSKLIHGGLRYLETYQFRLVREALQEREVLMQLAPHIIQPLRFVLPHVPAMRPRWMIQTGLWLYDHIGGPISLPRSHALKLDASSPHSAMGRPLLPTYTQGFAYSDCWVEDMRLVVLNAMDAAGRGAVIKTRTRLTAAAAQDGYWNIRLTGPNGQDEVRARVLVNAAGPWVGEVAGLLNNQPTPRPQPVRLVKGSHLVVPRLYEGDWAYICQNEDGRVVFFLPYEQDFTLIGTTDIPFDGNPASVTCSDEERDYLLGVAARFFRHPPSSFSVIHSFAGVRSLYDDGKANAKDVTRDYVLKFEQQPAPLLSIYGGKITTYRRLAEHALNELAPLFPALDAPWTGLISLPGGDLGTDLASFTAERAQRWPWLTSDLLRRWCRLYGTRIGHIVGSAASMADLGEQLAPGLCEAEADYLQTAEFAQTAEDMLWRRTRLGLRLTPGQVAHLASRL